MSDVTRILSQIESGDPSAAEQLLPLVYDELRKLAAAKLAHEKPGQTLQATALVYGVNLNPVNVRSCTAINSASLHGVRNSKSVHSVRAVTTGVWLERIFP